LIGGGFVRFPQLRVPYYRPALYRQPYRNYRDVVEVLKNKLLEGQSGTKTNVRGHRN